MNIGIWHGLPSGGGKRALYDQIKRLIELGHNITCWTFSDNEKQFLDLEELCEVRRVAFFTNDADIYSTFKKPYLIWKFKQYYSRVFTQISKEANDLGIEVFLVHPESYFRVPFISNYLKVPALIYLQEPYRWLYEAIPTLPYDQKIKSFKGLQEIISAFYQHRLEKKNLLKYKKILVNSFFSRESIARAYGLESVVNYLGINTKYFSSTTNEKQNYCVGLGTIYHAKGIDRAINVLSMVPFEIRPPLVWIGNGAWGNDLNYYKELALEKKVQVKFIVNASHDEVLEKLSQAKFMIYTSRLEPFGYAPLEAMACGTPVAALPEGGVRETVIDGINGILSPDGSLEGLAKRITIALKCSEFEILTKTAKESVEKWSIEKSVDELVLHLSEITQIKTL